MEGGGALGEMVAVVMGSGVAAAVVMVTAEEDKNATSAKLLIIEGLTCGLIRLDCHSSGLAVCILLLAVRERD